MSIQKGDRVRILGGPWSDTVDTGTILEVDENPNNQFTYHVEVDFSIIAGSKEQCWYDPFEVELIPLLTSESLLEGYSID